jgi:BirA family biotin operon repressor/biotin-[acetyl-CoA-carboxylase] ligase
MAPPREIAEALLIAGDRLGPMEGRLVWHDEADSTNTIALGLAEHGADEGTLVAADRQTAGRGRRGRTWASPAGAGIYASVVLRPSLRAAPFLTIAAGVAIAEGIAAASGLQCDLKWPNDVHVGDRKLAGILAEGTAGRVVVGFGINVRPASMPPDVAARATAIGSELGRDVDRGLVLVECLAALWQRYQHVEARRERDVLDAWRARAGRTMGRPIQWHPPSLPEGQLRRGKLAERGTMVGIDEEGALLMDTGERVVRIVSGEVEWL